jgi:hypothetical protein
VEIRNVDPKRAHRRLVFRSNACRAHSQRPCRAGLAAQLLDHGADEARWDLHADGRGGDDLGSHAPPPYAPSLHHNVLAIALANKLARIGTASSPPAGRCDGASGVFATLGLQLERVRAAQARGVRVELWFQDEARIGQKNRQPNSRGISASRKTHCAQTTHRRISTRSTMFRDRTHSSRCA